MLFEEFSCLLHALLFSVLRRRIVVTFNAMPDAEEIVEKLLELIALQHLRLGKTIQFDGHKGS